MSDLLDAQCTDAASNVTEVAPKKKRPSRPRPKKKIQKKKKKKRVKIFWGRKLIRKSKIYL